MNVECIAGVDEAGRGPLAGPVIAAAVILHPDKSIKGLRDSKKLTAAQREMLAKSIKINALAWALGRAEADEIDEINILQASMCAMQRAIAALHIQPSKVLVDGNRCPSLPMPAAAIIGGDDCMPAISAASIIAKVTRDQEMQVVHAQFPVYGFDQHKGYPTKLHMLRLRQHGICSQHRKTYAPVRNILQQAALI